MNSPVPSQNSLENNEDSNYWLLALPILVLGIILRQWNLGVPPFHPDEAIHAFFSQGFAKYHYDPVYHGPLLYHLVAGIFGLMGQNEYTARLMPSLLGVALLWMVLGPMRQYLGDRGALWSAALLAISPAVVTYSRRLLHDSLVLTLTLGAVLCFLGALHHPAHTTRGRTCRVGLAAFLVCFLATKANCFFVAALLFTFYLVWLCSGWLRALQRFTPYLLGLAWIGVVAGSIYWPRATSTPAPLQDTEHFRFQVLVLGCTVAVVLFLLSRAPQPDEGPLKRPALSGAAAVTWLLAGLAATVLYFFLFGGVAQTLAALYMEPGNLKLDLKEGWKSAVEAVPAMLKYWGGQQAKPRLPGRHDYYLVLFLIYELPLLLAGLAGLWHAARHRSLVTDLLVWWAFATWAVYAVANEKVPWLTVHMALPLALLGGVFLGRLTDQLAEKVSLSTLRRTLAPAALVLFCFLGSLFCLRGVSATNFEASGDNAEPMFYAQTPDEFRDALARALERTRGDNRPIWMNSTRQWPSVWYLRRDVTGMGESRFTFSGPADVSPDLYRFVIAEEAEWHRVFVPRKWQGEIVDFLIWPRASWGALRPHRFWPWFLYRDAAPADERKVDHRHWKKSILSDDGEWSVAATAVGAPPFF